MKSIPSLVLVGVASAVLAACSTPINPPTAVTPAVNPTPAPAQVNPAAAGAVASATLPAYLDPTSPISKERSVYFDFDDSSVKPEYRTLVELHGKYLSEHPSVAIRIEGNTDERGSHEYNLALGQRRAQAVLQSLKILGAKESQMEAISFGEEKPMATDHDETAWAKNRRADLDYPKK
jgi:peptidoglycan-associated lipoprotein